MLCVSIRKSGGEKDTAPSFISDSTLKEPGSVWKKKNLKCKTLTLFFFVGCSSVFIPLICERASEATVVARR
jgi:hypothetical protein